MSDTTVTKVNSDYSPTGKMGQKYLAMGVSLGMRLCEDEPYTAGTRRERRRPRRGVRPRPIRNR